MNIIPWRRREPPVSTGTDLDEFFQRFWGDGNGDLLGHLPEVFRARPVPPVNIAETEDSFSITMDCPGLDEGDFLLETMGKQLLISGERNWEQEKKGKEFRRVESQYGKFQRTVQLPDNANTSADAIQATYRKGILTVLVPKLERTPASKIPVQTG